MKSLKKYIMYIFNKDADKTAETPAKQAVVEPAKTVKTDATENKIVEPVVAKEEPVTKVVEAPSTPVAEKAADASANKNKNETERERRRSAMIKLKINNRVVEVEEGSTILQAARKAGIFIPTFCQDDFGRLPAEHCMNCNEYGDCKICSCKVEGEVSLLTACNTQA